VSLVDRERTIAPRGYDGVVGGRHRRAADRQRPRRHGDEQRQVGSRPPHLSLLIMVGVLVVGFIANLKIGPVDSRFNERVSEAPGDEQRFFPDRERVSPSRVRGTTTSGSRS
jgi:hypothetical protein